MAATTNLQLVISAKDNASATLRSVGGQVNALGNSPGFRLLGSAAKVATAAVAGLGLATVAFGVASVKAFGEAELTQKRFETALKNIAKASDIEVAALREQQTALSRTTMFEDEAIASAQGFLATFALNAKQIEKITPNLLDMAEGLRTVEGGTIGLEQASNMLGKAMQLGTLSGLRRIGVTIPGTTEKMRDLYEQKFQNANMDQRLAMVGEVLRGNFEGQAKAAGETLAGKIAILTNEYGNLKERIGEVLVKALMPTFDAIGNFVKSKKFEDWVNSLVKKLELWIDSMGGPEGVKNKLTEVGKKVLDFMSDVKDLTPRILSLVASIASLVAKITDFVNNHPELTKVLGVLVAIAGSAAMFNPLAGIIVGLISIFNSLIGIVRALKDIWVSGMQKNRAELELLGLYAEIAVRRIKDAFNNIGDRLRDAFGSAGEWIKDKFDGLSNFFKSIADKIVAPFKGIGDRIESAFGSIGDSIRGKIISAIDFINRAIAGYNRLASKTKLPSLPEIRYQFGGYVEAGRPVLVGEHGPEVFVPSQGGSVRPGAGGAGTVNINFGGVTITGEADENRLVDKISRALTEQNNLGYLGIR